MHGMLKRYAPDDLSHKITSMESTPRFNGSYSDVYIGRFGNMAVSLQTSHPSKNEIDRRLF
jgi:hypothetical protein